VDTVVKENFAQEGNMDRKKLFQVAVVGSGDSEPELMPLASEVGSVIAGLGAVLICGGLGGIMESAARGAKANQGLTIGILPSYDRHSANPYIDIAIPTGLGHARNVLVAAAGDAIVALPGSYGTRAEVSLGLRLGKPVFGIRAWREIPGVTEIESAEGLRKVLMQIIK